MTDFTFSKAMLACKYDEQRIEDYFKTGGYLLGSPKLDGIRGLAHPDGIKGRSNKLLKNRQLQLAFKDILRPGVDGEFIDGEPNEGDVYNRTYSPVMAKDRDIGALRFWVFDDFSIGHLPFAQRLKSVQNRFDDRHPLIQVVPHVELRSLADVQLAKAQAQADGYEGWMLRRPDFGYRNDRSTAAELGLMKLKDDTDAEAQVFDMEEAMFNGNEAFTDELGRTARSTAKAGLSGKGMVGAFWLFDHNGPGGARREFKVSAGKFDHPERVAIWNRRAAIIFSGLYLKYRYFGYGEKDLPRHGRAIGWRDPVDMG